MLPSFSRRLRTYLQLKDGHPVRPNARASEVVGVSRGFGEETSIPGRLAPVRKRGIRPANVVTFAQGGARGPRQQDVGAAEGIVSDLPRMSRPNNSANVAAYMSPIHERKGHKQ